MQFRVPQFIDIEDKILGPLTWKQASYCLGAVGVFYLSFRLIDSKLIALIVASPITGIFLAMAFIRINNQSFVDVMENAFKFYTNSKLYTWKKEEIKEKTVNIIKRQEAKDLLSNKPRKSLKDLALGLDIKVENKED